MIHIYGDSHAQFSFAGLTLPHVDHNVFSVTMHRIGRDRTIVNFNPAHHRPNDILCFVYGEVDCRCHVQRQINAGGEENAVIQEMVHNYFLAISSNKTDPSHKVVVVAVIPPVSQIEYERINGPIAHQYPFGGSDEDRGRFRRKMNIMIESSCGYYGYLYTNPYAGYEREDGMLKLELSDTSAFLLQFEDAISIFTSEKRI